MLGAGRRNVRISILAPVVVRDAGDGSARTAWQVLAQVWGAVEELAGRETERAAAVEEQVDCRVRLPMLTWLTAAHRLSWRGREYGIRSVVDADGNRRELVVLCTHGDGGHGL